MDVLANLPAVQEAFERNFAEGREVGAAISVWHRGEEVLHLEGGLTEKREGISWQPDTLVLVWSATKGLSAATFLHVLHRHGVALEAPVVEVWPEYGQAGKEKTQFLDFLTHRAGLCALEEKVDIYDYSAVIGALERARPLFAPGTTQAYHARTMGFLLDEVVRRLEGRSLGEYWQAEIAVPCGIDAWIGLPDSERSRLAISYNARPDSPVQDVRIWPEIFKPGSLVRRTFQSPVGVSGATEMRKSKALSVGFPAMGGVASARGLAKFYAILAHGGRWEGRPVFDASILRHFEQSDSEADDLILHVPVGFAAGMCKDVAAGRNLMGPSPRAFGHGGAGGSHAFADPENDLAFAYVMNQMEKTVLPNDRATRMVEALYSGAMVLR